MPSTSRASSAGLPRIGAGEDVLGVSHSGTARPASRRATGTRNGEHDT